MKQIRPDPQHWKYKWKITGTSVPVSYRYHCWRFPPERSSCPGTSCPGGSETTASAPSPSGCWSPTNGSSSLQMDSIRELSHFLLLVYKPRTFSPSSRYIPIIYSFGLKKVANWEANDFNCLPFLCLQGGVYSRHACMYVICRSDFLSHPFVIFSQFYE